MEDQGIERDREDRARQDEALGFLRQEAQRYSQARQDEGELADLRQAGRHRQRRVEQVAEGEYEKERGERFAEDDDGHDDQDAERLAEQNLGVEQHADRDEEQHRERVAQRQRLGGGPVAQGGLPHHHPGEERPERERHAEQLGGAVGDPDRGRDDAEGEELPRAGAGHLPEEPGEEAPAEDDHERDEGRDLGQSQRESQQK